MKTENPPRMRMSERLGLQFPYDWSNPSISDEALILNVLERGIFIDVCKVCAYFGMEKVQEISDSLPNNGVAGRTRVRILSNIKKGFSHA